MGCQRPQELWSSARNVASASCRWDSKAALASLHANTLGGRGALRASHGQDAHATLCAVTKQSHNNTQSEPMKFPCSRMARDVASASCRWDSEAAGGALEGKALGLRARHARPMGRDAHATLRAAPAKLPAELWKKSARSEGAPCASHGQGCPCHDGSIRHSGNRGVRSIALE